MSLSLRRLMVLAVVMLLAGYAPLVSAQTLPRTNIVETRGPSVETTDAMLPIIIGLGAIAGVVTFNVLALGVEALPGGLALAGGAIVPAEMSVAVSRVYATISAVVGGLVANYAYSQ
jgi:hypothetical protein